MYILKVNFRAKIGRFRCDWNLVLITDEIAGKQSLESWNPEILDPFLLPILHSYFFRRMDLLGAAVNFFIAFQCPFHVIKS
jgi:hypothetical protein